MKGLYTVVELDGQEKWFVAAEKEIDGVLYNYLIRVNNTADDFLDEYMIVKNYISEGNEYMDLLDDEEEVKKIIPELIPDSIEYMKYPERLIEELKESV